MFYLTLAVVALVLLVLVVLFPFFLQWLAEEDILFTTVKEGTVKTIVRGKAFDRFIMAFAGYHLNDPVKSWYKAKSAKWEVMDHSVRNENGFVGKEATDAFYDERFWLLKHLGLHWVGWPWANSVYVYAFEWNETYTDSMGKEQILPRAEATDFIYVNDFTYAIVTDLAKTKDRLPTDEHTFVTVAIRNPYRALFSGEDWMRRVTAAINRHVRDFVGKRDFKELISSKNDREFSEPIIELNGKLPDDKDKEPLGLHGRYGVEIRTADLQTIELSGDAKKQDQEATTREYVAKQEAAATLLKGQAEADVISMRGKTEAAALKARLEVIKEHGEVGITLAGYDAIQESSKGPGNTVIWANNPLSPIAELFKPTKGGEK